MLKKVVIKYKKGKSDEFITEHGYTNIDKFARMQAIIRKTDIVDIKIQEISA